MSEMINKSFMTLTGLLVEPNVRSYKKLLMKNRKARYINTCLSTTKLPSLVDFTYMKELSGIKGIVLCLNVIKNHDLECNMRKCSVKYIHMIIDCFP